MIQTSNNVKKYGIFQPIWFVLVGGFELSGSFIGYILAKGILYSVIVSTILYILYTVLVLINT
jgi:hypothetical protein